MRLRATIQIRNDHMLEARERFRLTQADVAGMACVTVNLISRLERLQYPATYRYEEALLIADALHIPVESVLPEEMVGWKGRTKFAYTEEVSTERLLDYENNIKKHYILPSPIEAADKSDNLERLRLMLKTLSFREEEVIKLRYGLDHVRGGPYTLLEIAKKLKVTRERVRGIEAKALHRLELSAENKTIMELVNKKSICTR